MKINSMFFIAMCGLCISCGAEITETDTSSEVLSDRQIPACRNIDCCRS